MPGKAARARHDAKRGERRRNNAKASSTHVAVVVYQEWVTLDAIEGGELDITHYYDIDADRIEIIPLQAETDGADGTEDD